MCAWETTHRPYDTRRSSSSAAQARRTQRPVPQDYVSRPYRSQSYQRNGRSQSVFAPQSNYGHRQTPASRYAQRTRSQAPSSSFGDRGLRSDQLDARSSYARNPYAASSVYQAPRMRYQGVSDDIYGGARTSAYRGASYVPTATAEQLPETDEPNLHVVPGAGRSPQRDFEKLPEPVVTLAKIIAVVFIVFAAVAIVRVVISSASAMTSLQTQELTQDINAMRNQTAQMEVDLSALSNPAHIQQEAATLGMAAPDPSLIDQIDLSGDIVAVDEAGSLSLSESTASLASSAM